MDADADVDVDVAVDVETWMRMWRCGDVDADAVADADLDADVDEEVWRSDLGVKSNPTWTCQNKSLMVCNDGTQPKLIHDMRQKLDNSKMRAHLAVSLC